MKTLNCQIINSRLIPHTDIDAEVLKAYKPNQVLRLEIKSVADPVTSKMYGLWWSCCTAVSKNVEDWDRSWNTPEKVCEQVKITIKYVDYHIIAEGKAHIKTKSISRANIKKFAMLGLMDEGLKVMADKIGVEVEDLVNNSDGGM